MLGENLVKLREDKGLSQKEAAQGIGISNVVLNRYEKNKNKPDPEMLSRLADFYGVSIDFLVRGQQFETEAAHRQDDSIDDLPPEARKSLEEYKAFIRQKYGKKEG